MSRWPHTDRLCCTASGKTLSGKDAEGWLHGLIDNIPHPDWVALQTRQAGLEGTGATPIRSQSVLRVGPARGLVVLLVVAHPSLSWRGEKRPPPVHSPQIIRKRMRIDRNTRQDLTVFAVANLASDLLRQHPTVSDSVRHDRHYRCMECIPKPCVARSNRAGGTSITAGQAPSLRLVIGVTVVSGHTGGTRGAWKAASSRSATVSSSSPRRWP